MAQNTSSPRPAGLRNAIAATRGAVLAMHAAAGLAVTADREAARMLRASEGLARAAAALLECAGRQVTSNAKPVKEEAKKNEAKNSKKDLSGKGKGQGKGKGKKVVSMEVEAQGVVAAAAPLRADAGTFIPAGEPELTDEWADGIVVHGPANLPPAQRLLRRRSGSRSPRGAPEQPLPVASPLVAGHLAAIKTLLSRPELDGQHIRLIEFDAAAGRWQCALRSGERLRIHQGKIQSVNPAFQRTMEQKFAESV